MNLGEASMSTTSTSSTATAARLLVVEDEATIRDGLIALFESQGFAVDAVGDGLSALERTAVSEYDLVLLDLMIPGLPGLDVLTRLRARGLAVPVLVLTAKGSEQDVVAGIERGADDYVSNRSASTSWLRAPRDCCVAARARARRDASRSALRCSTSTR